MALKNGNLRLLITIGVMLVGVASAWGVMKATVDSVDTLAQENKVELKQKVDQEDFKEVQQDVKEITIKVAKMETMQAGMDKKLDRILDKLDED